MKNLLEIIRSTRGKFFTVTFIKKDGTERKLNGRLGVRKGTKGGTNGLDDRFLTVFDVKVDGFRAVNKETIKSVKFGGKVYE